MLRQATHRDGIQLCVKTVQMTMTRAWTLEMTEDWTHTRIKEHDKACVLQSTVEHNVVSEQFKSSLAHHLQTLTSEGKCKEEIVHASLEEDVAKKKTPWSVPSTDVMAETRKKKVQKTTQLSSDSSATFAPRRTPNGAPPRTAHIAISSSVAKSPHLAHGCEGI